MELKTKQHLQFMAFLHTHFINCRLCKFASINSCFWNGLFSSLLLKNTHCVCNLHIMGEVTLHVFGLKCQFLQ